MPLKAFCVRNVIARGSIATTKRRVPLCRAKHSEKIPFVGTEDRGEVYRSHTDARKPSPKPKLERKVKQSVEGLLSIHRYDYLRTMKIIVINNIIKT